MDPLFNELAVNDSAEELSIYVDRLSGRSDALQEASVNATQRPMRFNHIALRKLPFDSQIEIVQYTSVTAYALLEALRARALIWVVRIVIHILRGEQLVDCSPVSPFQTSSNCLRTSPLLLSAVIDDSSHSRPKSAPTSPNRLPASPG